MSVLDKITARLDLLYLKEEEFRVKFKTKVGGPAFDKLYREHLLKWKIHDYKQLSKKKQEEFWTEFQENWDKHPEAIGFDESISEAESGDKEAYQKFFQGKLKKYGVKSPSELDDEKKKKFFDEVDKEWKAKDESTKISEAESGDKEAYQKFFQGKLKKYGVKSPSELDDEKKKKFFDEVDKEWKAKDESTIYEISTPDRHQLKIAIDTIKNPMKGKFLGGPTAEEAEEILRKKFKYTDSQIKKLKESTKIDEVKVTVYDNGGKTADRYMVFIGKDGFSMSDNATSPNGVNMYAGELGSDIHPTFLKSMKQVKVTSLPQAVQKAIKDRMEDSEY